MTSNRDILSWKLKQDGHLTVKYFYDMLMDSNEQDYSVPLWIDLESPHSAKNYFLRLGGREGVYFDHWQYKEKSRIIQSMCYYVNE